MTRVGAVVSKVADFQEQRFGFFIPSAEIATKSELHSSHVYLEDLAQCSLSLAKSFLIRLPDYTHAESFLSTLQSIAASFVVVVPVVEDFQYWQTLKHFLSHFEYVLQEKSPISSGWIRRYMCLNYTAVTFGNNITKEIALKTTEPDFLVFLDEVDSTMVANAHRRAHEVTSELKRRKFVNYLIDPLQPLTEEMPMEVYQTFEEDKSKYAAYEEAIDLAISDLFQSKKKRLSVLVVGPGRGPLLAFAAKYLDRADIVAIERNSKCIPKLKDDNNKLWNRKVNVIEGDARSVASTPGKFDLIISELIGSFGCNEACPEILAPFTEPGTIMIPQTIKCFIRPIYCGILDKDYSRPYLLKSDRSFEVGKTVQVFDFSFPGYNELGRYHETEFHFEYPDTANALEGVFKAELYGHISISNAKLDSTSYVCTSWYPMIFPITPVKCNLKVSMNRVSQDEKLWYEWVANDLVKNKYGKEYFVSLS